MEVERVMKNERVDGPLPMREEGDTMIIPVVKQILRVDWVLTEEVHLTRHRRVEHSHHPVTVLEEHAEVERVGEAVNRESEVDTRGALGGRRPSFLGKLEK